jgi:hypothetical protein
MPCLVGCFALFFPRLAIILVWLFGNGWLQTAYQSMSIIWPLIGFFVMPLTVLAYALAWHMGSGQIDGFGIAIIIIAALIDFGIIGGSASSKEARRYYRRTEVRVR